MEIELIHHTPLWVSSAAIRTCWDSGDKSDTINTDDRIGEKDRELIHRVGNKNKHSSTLEHLYYNFAVSGTSSALLQELARHRMASLSVKSTRYTLKELKSIDKPFIEEITKEEYNKHFDMGPLVVEFFGKYYYINDNVTNNDITQKVVGEEYVVTTQNSNVNTAILLALENVRLLLKNGISNDIAKFALPEAYKTAFSWSINARALQNFLALRTSKSAMWEIREFAYNVYNTLPEEHKYLYTEFMETQL